MAPTPPRSRDQRLAALERANRIRFARARLKREMHGAGQHGRRLLDAALIRDARGINDLAPDVRLEDGDLDTAKVFDVLLWAPGIGRSKANRILTAARISPSKSLAGLSARQLGELLEFVRIHAPNTNTNGGLPR